MNYSTVTKKLLDEYPDILSAADIAGYLRISRRRVYELMILAPTHGGIPNIVIGASKRVRKETFRLWLDKLEGQTG